ncbi:MAG: 2-amino-4-hydroxy-6-hydroxymethyldihydropteridine diphosphokinase [Treponema sp.]|jgi:2-amino-4-hydroxy-6-hydroxymethyldihydropteridine diphosphokinase|nr:2-amino-4-hydroxy-6-hydroxymethyldihydropteridine diphosphokinase [Treponema sp.]
MASLIVLGLGSNKAYKQAGGRVQTPRELLEEGARKLSGVLSGLRIAPMFETDPLYVTDQPRFLNTAACGWYEGAPHELLSAIHDIEASCGRNRAEERRFGERTLDIDILLFGGLVMSEPDLEIPHPRLAERIFALIPLLALLPDAKDPRSGALYRDILTRRGGGGGMRIALFRNNLYEEYQGSVYSGVRAQAEELGVDLICIQSESVNTDSLFISLDFIGVDGVLILSSVLMTKEGFQESSETFARLHRLLEDIPAVSIGRDMSSTATGSPRNYPSIVVKNEESMKSLMDHLIEVHGYRKFLYIGGPESHMDNAVREAVFKASVEACGGSYIIINGGFHTASGRDIIRGYINANKDDPPDAIIAANDNMALGVLEVIHEKTGGKWERCAVTGFDDLPLARMNAAALTTVRQPLYEMGREAVRMLKHIIEKKEVSPLVTIESEVKIRNSCGCAGYVDDKQYGPSLSKMRNNFMYLENYMQNVSYLGQRLITAGSISEIISHLQYFLTSVNVFVFYLFLYPEFIPNPGDSGLLLYHRTHTIDTFYEKALNVKFYDFFHTVIQGGADEPPHAWCLYHLRSGAEYLGLVVYEVSDAMHPLMCSAALFIANSVKRLKNLEYEEAYTRKLEQEVALRTQQIVTANKKLEEEVKRRITVEAEVLRISEMERLRFSLDLHDDICQRLAGISMLCRSLASGVSPKTLLPDLSEMIDETLVRTRRYAHESFPVELDSLGLNDALGALCNSFNKQEGCKCVYSWRGPTASPLDHAQDINVYRIIQEALANVTKHANASVVEVSLINKGAQLTIAIKDNGKGNPRINCGQSPQPVPKRRREGLGLRSMQYRAHQLSAAYMITSSERQGTLIEIRIPFHKKDANP